MKPLSRIVRGAYARVRRFFVVLYLRRTYLILRRGLDGAVPERVARTQGELVELRSPDDLARLEGTGVDLSTCDPGGDIVTGLKAGARLLCFVVDGHAAHFTWYALRREQALFDGLFPQLEFSRCGYVGPCHTAPGHRGQGIYPMVVSEACRRIQGLGMTCAMISTHSGNVASIRGVEKVGFVLAARVPVRWLFGHRRVMLEQIQYVE